MAADTFKSAKLSAEVQEILSKNSHLKYLPDNGKIKCRLSGHEMSCDVKVVNCYLQGKKHKRLKALNDYDFDKYKQHLVDSTKKFPKNQLLCLLTSKYINNRQPSIQKHINGCKFKKAFKKWEECQKEGKEYVYLKKQKPNCPEKFENFENPKKNKKRNKKPKYEENEEKESDNDSLSDLYPKEESLTDGKKSVVSKKQKPNPSDKLEKTKKKTKYEENKEEESDDSSSDPCPNKEFQKKDKGHKSVNKRKHDSENNIGRKKKKAT